MRRAAEDLRGPRDYTREIAIAAPRARAFDAIATLGGLRGWWTPLARGSDRPGGRVRLEFEGLDEHIDLRLIAARRPSEVEWAVVEHSSLEDWNGTTLRFALSAQGPKACVLAFRHLGLTPRLDCFDDCKVGWEHFLASLRALAERGIGHPFGSPRPSH